MSTLTPGFDAAQGKQEDDDLDRWRFAAEVVEVILTTPSDWSARIGIFGKWGDGKSTVLRFAEQMLKENGNIVFWFSPWSVGDWQDLWDDFGSALLDALSGADIEVDDSWKKWVKDSTRWLESTGASQVAEAAAGVFGKDKMYTSAFRLVSRLLKYDGPQIRAIRERLGGKRVVVVIDDLDRCAPELLPRLLMSLREILDLPGFTFLLAFDDEIVARALASANPAWMGGANFLEKILDFRYHLPTVTEKQKERLTRRAMSKYCPFVPPESTSKIQDLLLDNPRKLKSLIRSLASLQPQVARHGTDELNWVDLWLAQMLRHESYPFFELLLKGDNLEEVAGYLYSIKEKLSERKGKKEENEQLRHLLEQAGIEDPDLVKRLTRLVEASRSRSSQNFRYMCELANRPHALTWKEFRSIRAKWEAESKPSVLVVLIANHAVERAVSVDDVDDELFQAMIGDRNRLLDEAGQSKSVLEHKGFADQASKLLAMIEEFLVGLGKLDAQRFGKVYGQATYWIGFRKNSADLALRNQEEALLLKLLSGASTELSTELLEEFLPDFDIDVGDGVLELKEALREKCMAIVAPKAAEEAISFMTREGGIQSLTEQGRFAAVKYCLFKADSPMWNTGLRNDLIALIRKGRDDSRIYSNVSELFDLMMRGLKRGIDSTIGVSDVVALLSNQELVRALWDTVTSRAIQYRMRMSYLEARQLLVQNGVPEEILPLTDELKLRAEEDARFRANRQNATPATG
jgi:KAP family P-loop domain